MREVDDALDIALNDGTIDGNHHKAWVIDQMVRKLVAVSKYRTYEEFIRQHADGEDGPNTYEWDTGIAP